MEPTTLTLHTAFQIGQVDPRLFGGFLEHLRCAVYGGVYDPDSKHADERGFRTDVLAVLRGLDMTAMRYPGGNFASGYHWADGVGPRQERPRVKDLAWHTVETNQFGTDEFLALCRAAGWTPMLTVNLGTGTPEEAGAWVEYCNSPAGTRYADMRVANGHAEPYGVGLWCLGNEMDGPWQLGHVPAEQYALRAGQAAKIMREVDPSIELVLCGTSSINLPTYMEWDRQALEYVGDRADYLSLHRYVENVTDDTADYLAITNAIDRQIEEMDAACRYVQAKRRSRKRAYLCFDEWNAWFRHRGQTGGVTDLYTLEDALVVAGFLHSFLRHADVLKIANIAQIVNVIAPVLTRGDEVLLNTIYYPFQMFSRRRNGVALRPSVHGPRYKGVTHGEVNTVDTSAVLDAERLHVFLTSRDLTERAPVRVVVADRSIARLEEGELLTGPDAKAVNSFEQPDVCVSRPFASVTFADGGASFELPPLSFAALTFALH